VKNRRRFRPAGFDVAKEQEKHADAQKMSVTKALQHE
jgi:hypothetical protein